jgi:hypothetical protein
MPGLDRQGVGARLALQRSGDLPDHLGRAAFARDHRGKLGKALCLGHHQPVDRDAIGISAVRNIRLGTRHKTSSRLPPS